MKYRINSGQMFWYAAGDSHDSVNASNSMTQIVQYQSLVVTVVRSNM